MAHIYAVIAQLAKELKLEKGYRVVANCRRGRRPDGGPPPLPCAGGPFAGLASRLTAPFFALFPKI